MKFKYLLVIIISSALSASVINAQDEKKDPGNGEKGDFEKGKGKGKGFQGKGGPRGGGMMRFMPVLAALDADKDGKISSEELDNATAALKTLDKNGDGELTEDELRPNFGGRGKGGPGRGGPGGMGEKGKGGKGGKGKDDADGEAIPKRPPIEE